MIIEFMFNNIKNIELIYLIKETYDEDFDDNIEEEQYLGTDYCQNPRQTGSRQDEKGGNHRTA